MDNDTIYSVSNLGMIISTKMCLSVVVIDFLFFYHSNIELSFEVPFQEAAEICLIQEALESSRVIIFKRRYCTKGSPH